MTSSVLVLLVAVFASASSLHFNAIRKMNNKLVIASAGILLSGGLMFPSLALAEDIMDITDDIVMTPKVIQEKSQAMPKVMAMRDNVAPAFTAKDKDGDSFMSSLKKEQMKQEEQKKTKSSKSYRNDLCETLGRGC
jgi:ribosomal protein S1